MPAPPDPPPAPLTIGSLFSGYGGLDLAVERVFNARTVWQAEWEDAPSAVLARHWPDVPNLRDVTAVDWSSVPPVDIITGGFPCQDVSVAGRRAGMTEGTRSNLWGAMRTAIETIRPTYVVAENVRGLLSAKAESARDMEPGPGLLGDPRGGSLRALGRVLGDLADMRYDAQWYGLRASDVGAPHHRFRVFILATRQDVPHPGGGGSGGRAAGPEPSRRDHATLGPGAGRDGGREPAGIPDAASDGRDEGRTEPAGQLGRPHAPLGGAPAPDAGGGGWFRRGPVELAGPPENAPGHGSGPGTAPDAVGLGREGDGAGRPGAEHLAAAGSGASAPRGGGVDWGPYAAAVHRWEPIVGRRAPAPTELTDRGKHRLSPRFTEWMMGLPDGWVTDTPGIKRNPALKMLGNGVVTQQAVAALQHMLTD